MRCFDLVGEEEEDGESILWLCADVECRWIHDGFGSLGLDRGPELEMFGKRRLALTGHCKPRYSCWLAWHC